MNSHTRREISEILSISGCSEYSNRTPTLKLEIALPEHESTKSAPSSRKPKQTAAAVWVILLLVIALTATFWATYQLCGLLAQRMQQIQRQRYQPQVAYSDVWTKGRHW